MTGTVDAASSGTVPDGIGSDGTVPDGTGPGGTEGAGPGGTGSGGTAADETAADGGERGAEEAGRGEGARRAGRGSALDLLRSTLLVAVLVAAVVLLLPRPDRTPVATVDVAAEAASVSARAGFPVAVPRDLPPGWTATGAALFEGSDGVTTWRVTYRTPAGDPVGFVQGLRATPGWEGRMVIDGRESGSRRIDGNWWIDRSRTDRGITNLVLRRPELTTIVTGRADLAELETLVRSLRLPA